MKLSPKQINTIDAYLKHHKVRFWDVRMELLDHLVHNVEAHMEGGQSFDEALMRAHLSFGNKRTSKKLNKDNTRWIITESVYADNSGYKKLLAEKQKQHQKGLLKLWGKTILALFRNPLFLVAYFGTLFLLNQTPRTAIKPELLYKALYVVLLVPVSLPWVLYTWSFIKKKITLRIGSLVAVVALLPMSILNIFMNSRSLFFEKDISEGIPWFCIILFALVFPLVIAEIKLFYSEIQRLLRIQKQLA